MITLSPTANERFKDRGIQYFKKRGGVIFISRSRFWHTHPFCQQSLAYLLSEQGIPVTWYDGFGWRPYSPIVTRPNPNLRVAQLPSIPGRRIPAVRALDTHFTAWLIKKKVKELIRPVVWIQDGISDELARQLEYVDVFSVFDDPYWQDPQGELCKKASLIVTQNNNALMRFENANPHKTICMAPPVSPPQISEETFNLEQPFPRPVIGYVGSFHYDRFDFDTWTTLMRRNPQWGFLLAGRTDEKGAAIVESLKKHSNFMYVPHRCRNQISAIWKVIDICFHSYKSPNHQAGGFPSKTFESAYFGVPNVGIDSLMVRELKDIFPVADNVEALEAQIKEILPYKEKIAKEQVEKLIPLVDPYTHLERVVERLESTF